MSKYGKRYSVEFKERAIKLTNQVGCVQASKDLGVSVASLSKWATSTGTQPKESLNLLEENKRLKKELARLQEEREILKKAAIFFANHKK